MKKLLLIIITILTVKISSSQTAIPLSEVSKHVGDSVKVEGKVYGTRHFPDSKNTPALINIGTGFPNQLLTVVIYGDDRKNFKAQPEEYFKDKEVVVTGKVELYHGKPQIVVHDAGGIKERVVEEQKN